MEDRQPRDDARDDAAVNDAYYAETDRLLDKGGQPQVCIACGKVIEDPNETCPACGSCQECGSVWEAGELMRGPGCWACSGINEDGGED